MYVWICAYKLFRYQLYIIWDRHPFFSTFSWYVGIILFPHLIIWQVLIQQRFTFFLFYLTKVHVFSWHLFLPREFFLQQMSYNYSFIFSFLFCFHLCDYVGTTDLTQVSLIQLFDKGPRFWTNAREYIHGLFYVIIIILLHPPLVSIMPLRSFSFISFLPCVFLFEVFWPPWFFLLLLSRFILRFSLCLDE